MDVQFPLFVFEKDDRSMYLIETPERVFYHLEAIYIENNEYLFWDSTGAGVRISVARGAVSNSHFVTRKCRCGKRLRLRAVLWASSLSWRISNRHLDKFSVPSSPQKYILGTFVSHIKNLITS